MLLLRTLRDRRAFGMGAVCGVVLVLFAFPWVDAAFGLSTTPYGPVATFFRQRFMVRFMEMVYLPALLSGRLAGGLGLGRACTPNPDMAAWCIPQWVWDEIAYLFAAATLVIWYGVLGVLVARSGAWVRPRLVRT
ncbi:hypothetical protein HY632_00830 [Candidatus Uhrbacteria bacterium]|nr:hypothetical protein [Candidatus Uhrbacteria bacterium]